MTEDEAKTKWCPERTKHAAWSMPVGTPSDNHPKTLCIGSACMMWRQTRKGFVMADGRVAQEADGYCGLAGNPDDATRADEMRAALHNADWWLSTVPDSRAIRNRLRRAAGIDELPPSTGD